MSLLVSQLVRPEHNGYTRLKTLDSLHREWRPMKAFWRRRESPSNQDSAPSLALVLRLAAYLSTTQMCRSSWPNMPVPGGGPLSVLHPNLPGLPIQSSLFSFHYLPYLSLSWPFTWTTFSGPCFHLDFYSCIGLDDSIPAVSGKMVVFSWHSDS